MTTAPKTDWLKIVTLILGALLYVGALLLGWLADAPGEVVESMKGLAYAMALGTPMLSKTTTTRKAKAKS